MLWESMKDLRTSKWYDNNLINVLLEQYNNRVSDYIIFEIRKRSLDGINTGEFFTASFHYRTSAEWGRTIGCLSSVEQSLQSGLEQSTQSEISTSVERRSFCGQISLSFRSRQADFCQRVSPASWLYSRIHHSGWKSGSQYSPGCFLVCGSYFRQADVFSSEIFTVIERIASRPPRYRISDSQGRRVAGRWITICTLSLSFTI